MKEPLVKLAWRDAGGMQLLEVPAAEVPYYKSMGWTLLNAEPPAPKVAAPVIEESPVETPLSVAEAVSRARGKRGADR